MLRAACCSLLAARCLLLAYYEFLVNKPSSSPPPPSTPPPPPPPHQAHEKLLSLRAEVVELHWSVVETLRLELHITATKQRLHRLGPPLTDAQAPPEQRPRRPQEEDVTRARELTGVTLPDEKLVLPYVRSEDSGQSTEDELGPGDGGKVGERPEPQRRQLCRLSPSAKWRGKRQKRAEIGRPAPQKLRCRLAGIVMRAYLKFAQGLLERLQERLELRERGGSSRGRELLEGGRGEKRRIVEQVQMRLRYVERAQCEGKSAL